MKTKLIVFTTLVLMLCGGLAKAESELLSNDVDLYEDNNSQVTFTKNFENSNSSFYDFTFAIIKGIICSDSDFSKDFIEFYGVEYDEAVCDLKERIK